MPGQLTPLLSLGLVLALLAPSAQGEADTYRLMNRITPPNSEPGDFFGGSLDLVGQHLAVRSRNAYRDRRNSQIHIYQRENADISAWNEIANDTISHPLQFSVGQDLALWRRPGGVEAFIGLNQNSVNGVAGNGQIVTYTDIDNRAGRVWAVQGTITPDELSFGAAYGRSIDIDSSDNRFRQFIVGASGNAVNNSSAYVYERGEDRWEQVARLSSPDASPGPIGSRFGTSVAISGRTALVSAIADDNGLDTERFGSVYFFEQDNEDNWVQTQKVFSPGGSGFGGTVALHRDTAVVTALNKGAVYLYQRGEDAWELTGNLTRRDNARLWGSRSIALSDQVLAAGYHDGSRGWVDIYRQDNSSNWEFAERLTSPSGRETDYFGFNIALEGIDGRRLVVSDPGSDPTFINTSEPVTGEPGEVYLYELSNFGLPGDVDDNGLLNQNDLDAWAMSYGSNSVLAADINGDGMVDAADYSLIRDRVAGSYGATVPEPTAAVLVASLLAMLNSRCRARDQTELSVLGRLV